MKPKIRFELYRWILYFIFWLIGMGISIAIIEIIVGPVLQWLSYKTPYQLPTWHRAGRLTLMVFFIGFFAGTVSWYYEKRSSGR